MIYIIPTKEHSRKCGSTGCEHMNDRGFHSPCYCPKFEYTCGPCVFKIALEFIPELLGTVLFKERLK